MNADGYMSTGTSIMGHNMFAYCNSNPVNMKDSNGCMPTGIADTYISKYEIVIPEPADIIKNSINPTIDLTSRAVSKLLEKEPRPNNVGKVTWEKQISKQIKNVNNFSKTVTGVLDKFDYLEVFAETSLNIYDNAIEGKRLPKIAWDATIDTTILTANVYVAGEAGAALGTLIAPGGGTLAGVIIGGVIGMGLSYISDKPRRYLKTWVN